MKDWTQEEFNSAIREKRTFCLYFYTPMCGTCQVASKMLRIIEEMLPDLHLGKMNANYTKALAGQYQLESVPCLLLFEAGSFKEKIYAFQSVPFLYEKLGKLDKTK